MTAPLDEGSDRSRESGGSRTAAVAAESPLPPDSWPGAGGRRSVAPDVPDWPRTTPARSADPGASWPGAAPSGPGATAGTTATERTGAAPSVVTPPPPTDLDDQELRDLRLRRPHHLVSPKAKIVWRLASLLTWIWPAAALIAWFVFDPDPGRRQWQYLAMGVLGAWALFSIVVVPWWRYRVHRWEVTDEAVYTQAGWLFQERRVAPISRIQTVDSEFGPLEQMIGLGTLTVTTASAAGALRVSGLEKQTVRELVDHLTRITAQERGDAT